MRRITRKGNSNKRLFYGSLIPAIAYGVDQVGMTDRNIRQLEHDALQSLRMNINGADRRITWASSSPKPTQPTASTARRYGGTTKNGGQPHPLADRTGPSLPTNSGKHLT